jgi:Tol biopolymer transport system component
LLTVSVVLVGLLGLQLVAPTRADAAGGAIAGPLAGKFYASYRAKVGVNNNVVAFASMMQNFGLPGFEARFGVYYRDRTTNQTLPASRAIGYPAVFPDKSSFPLAVSGDAGTRFILFASDATNLVIGDTNNTTDAFVFDRVTGLTERVSVGDGIPGVQGTGGGVAGGDLSPDGRFVVFSSRAAGLVPGGTSQHYDVFLRDRQAGTTRLVSAGAGGSGGLGDSIGVAVSDDGRTVAFSSTAPDLVPSDGNFSMDVFVRDMTSNMTTRVSVGYAGEATSSSAVPQISADGRFVAFESEADDIVPGDENASTDVFVRDRFFGTTERVSVGPNGEEGQDSSSNPSMSKDGRYIAFQTDAEELSSTDGNLSTDIYVRDRLARVTARATEKQNGNEAFGDAVDPSISPEGRYVGFDSDSEEFTSPGNDTNDDFDVYVKDMGSGFVSNSNIGGRFWPVAPKRLLDTAAGPVPGGWTAGTKLGASTTLDLPVTGGSTTIPASATAVVLNVMASGETADNAEVAVYPTGSTPTSAVALHPEVGPNVANQIIAKVGTGGSVRFATNTGATHLTVDVVGWIAPDLGDAFTSLNLPSQLDTRGNQVPAGWPAGQRLAATGAFSRLDITVAGTDDVPATARAVALTITAIAPTSATARITAFPTGSANPGTPHVVPQPGKLITNTVTVPVGAGGKVSLAVSSGLTHVMVSLAGYYGPYGGNLYFPLNPTRVLDSKSTSASLGIPGHTGPLLSAEFASVPLAGRGGIPSNARDVAVNMSSTGVANGGVLIMWPFGAPMAVHSDLAYRSGVKASSTVPSGLGTNGRVQLFNFAATSVHIFADAQGYYR